MADTDTSTPTYELRLALDHGTSKTVCAYQAAPVGENPNADRTIILEIEDRHEYAPSAMAFVRERDQYRLRWGHSLQAELDSRSCVREKYYLFENAKMCLYPSPWQARHRRLVQQGLDRLAAAFGITQQLTPEWLMEFYLREILSQVGQQLCKAFSCSKDELDMYQHHWTYMVPESAAAGAVQVFAGIIERAGFPNAVPVSETETAAAYRLREHVRRQHGLSRDFQRDDQVISADGGALTLNVNAFAMLDLIEANVASTALHPINRNGTTFGSQVIFQKFWEDLEERSNDNLASACARLQVSAAQLRFLLCRHFDAFKASFPGKPHSDRIELGDRRKGTYLEFEVDRSKMQEWFAELRRSVVEGIRAVVTAGRTKIILLSGGLFHNSWLVQEVKDVFEPYGIDVPYCGRGAIGPINFVNVEGALARGCASHQHTSVAQHDWETLGIILDDPYDSSIHNDIEPSNGEGCSYYENVRTAPDRWHTLVPYGNLREGVMDTKEQWVTYAVPDKAPCKDLACKNEECPDCPKIHQEILCVRQSMAEREHALVEAESEDGPLYTKRSPALEGQSSKIEVKSWRVASKSINKQTLKQYRACGVKANTKREVTARLIITNKDSDVVVRWRLAAPEHRWSENDELPSTFHSFGLPDDTIHRKDFPMFISARTSWAVLV